MEFSFQNGQAARPINLMPSPVTEPESSENFADLMAAHQARLAGYIGSLITDRHAIRDILQETNVTILKKSRDFQMGTNFTAWSFRIAYFEVLTWRRKQGRDKLYFNDELVGSIAESVEESAPHYEERLKALTLCVAELPDRQREVIERRYLNSESVQAIADDLGFRPNAASQLLHRARTNLLKCVVGKTEATPDSESTRN